MTVIGRNLPSRVIPKCQLRRSKKKKTSNPRRAVVGPIAIPPRTSSMSKPERPPRDRPPRSTPPRGPQSRPRARFPWPRSSQITQSTSPTGRLPAPETRRNPGPHHNWRCFRLADDPLRYRLAPPGPKRSKLQAPPSKFSFVAALKGPGFCEMFESSLLLLGPESGHLVIAAAYIAVSVSSEPVLQRAASPPRPEGPFSLLPNVSPVRKDASVFQTHSPAPASRRPQRPVIARDTPKIISRKVWESAKRTVFSLRPRPGLRVQKSRSRKGARINLLSEGLDPPQSLTLFTPMRPPGSKSLFAGPRPPPDWLGTPELIPLRGEIHVFLNESQQPDELTGLSQMRWRPPTPPPPDTAPPAPH